MVDTGITKLAWVVTISNPSAPTAAELTAGIDLSCLMTTAYSVGFDASDTISEQAVCETANTVTPTLEKYQGNLVLFSSFTAGALDSGDSKNAFANAYEVGYFVRRIGLPYSTAFAAAQKVEVYKFMADRVQRAGGTAQGYTKITVPLLPQGFAKDQVTVA
jgi:hypothetical protein